MPAAKLLSAGYDLGTLSADIHVPFDVRRFANASVLWLNQTWFLELGVDVLNEAVRSSVEAWLLDGFACSAPQSQEPEDVYAGPVEVRHADRYGGTGGALHGGSGRSFCKEGFIAKGVGRTPLVATNADWYHSHGCLWIEEAVREAVSSEVLSRLAPFGAVRGIAIIDTGSRIYWGDGTTGERRAILVRPNFARLAHLERSLYFGGAGLPEAPQYLDARRTRDVVRALSPNDLPNFGSLAQPLSVEDAFGRIGRQIAFSHVNRLWPGPFLSSNITIDGRWADFGSFRSLPTWRRAVGDPKDPAFGEEHQQVALTAASITRSLSKELDSSPAHAAVMKRYRVEYEQGFAASARSLLPGAEYLSGRATEDCIKAIGTAFRAGQRVRVDAGGAPWDPRQDPDVEAAFNSLKTIYGRATSGWTGRGAREAIRTLDGLALGRPRLKREAVISEVAELGTVSSETVARYVDDLIASEGPLRSLATPSWLVTDAVATPYSRALLCLNPLTGETRLELQGVLDGIGRIYLFDQSFPVSAVPQCQVFGSTAAFQVRLSDDAIPREVQIGERRVCLYSQT